MPDQLDGPADDGAPPMPPPLPGAPDVHIVHEPMTEAEALDINAKLYAESARLENKISELQMDRAAREQEQLDLAAERAAQQAEADRLRALPPPPTQAQRIEASIHDKIAEANRILAEPQPLPPPPRPPADVEQAALQAQDARDAPHLAAGTDAVADAAASMGPPPTPPPSTAEIGDMIDRGMNDFDAAYEARAVAMGRWQEAVQSGASDDVIAERVSEYKACNELLDHIDGKLEALEAAQQASLEGPGHGPEPDDPEAKAELSDTPKPPRGSGDQAEPEAHLDNRPGHGAESNELTVEPPSAEAPTLDMADSHADAMKFAQAQLAPRGTPISEMAKMEITPNMSSAQKAAIISSRTFPDASEAAERTAQIQRGTHKSKTAKLVKVAKRGGRR